MKFEDDLNDKDVQDQWRRLQAAIEKKQAAGEQPVRAIRPGWKTSWKTGWKRSAGIAASLALLLAVSIWLIHEPSSRILYSTGYGEQKHITLPDSSRVVLNSNSSLSFDNNWQPQEPRSVELSGEAFFSVVHTGNNQRFIVNTPEGMEVQVLGTEFNVYDRRGIQRVVLNSGSVRLEYKDREAVSMAPGKWSPGKDRAPGWKRGRWTPPGILPGPAEGWYLRIRR
ncbi:FecR family protein [Anseongella ginsenosidimutans]|uniref:FecR family protein n=1 Tax=Anseongella ginsenosidimutans TaxID=496056 RepID=UPI0011C72266|nr:FecR family protein [Anseongella ginsenosidimutans]QEC51383.1 FecR domain-containing protein [Anseongella ginsenosidimutans]